MDSWHTGRILLNPRAFPSRSRAIRSRVAGNRSNSSRNLPSSAGTVRELPISGARTASTRCVNKDVGAQVHVMMAVDAIGLGAIQTAELV